MERLDRVINGQYENHIFPLFWMHGEAEDVLREYVGKVYESGIRAFCVEARPHPDFAGDGWWRDMEIVLSEAEKWGMHVWILDDSHFPTGYAGGEFENNYPQLRKRFLKLHQLDFAGPVTDAQVLMKYAFTDPDDRLLGVLLAKKTDQGIDPDSIMDISGGVKGQERVVFDLPEGEWRVLILLSTFTGGEKQTENYLNPIDPASVDVLIEKVYQPHYQHFADRFGTTIKGFFSDEPRFGNMHGALGSIGRLEMVLPWKEGLEVVLEERIGETILPLLPLLFVDGGVKAHQARYHYMELVSDLYSEHFSKRIGSWCDAHGVEYIGHVIEDNNSHSRLGYGAGHFFKSMDGQHMAGIDVVLHQLLPGMDHGINKSMTGLGWDGEFFHYVLGKLGSSLGHLDSRKKGRTMCEVFGAYGWAEGVRLMKWITDYMLVRGVNEFSPHAFNPGEYPDPDCPPHFYAHGRNPQFSAFGVLMRYMNRMSDLFSGGIHRAPVAILYHGEAEWSGDYMLMQKPAAILTRNQIDFDFVPGFMLPDAELKDRTFILNQEAFRSLIVPGAEALPAAYIRALLRLAEGGVKIVILEQMMIRSSEGIDVTKELKQLQDYAKVVAIDQLAKLLIGERLYEIRVSSEQPYLRYYHYVQPEGHLFLFVNEDPYKSVTTTVEIPVRGNYYLYDGMENVKKSVQIRLDGEISILPLNLEPYQSIVVVCAEEEEKDDLRSMPKLIREDILTGPFQVTLIEAGNGSKEPEIITLDQPVPLQEIAGREDFTGRIRYESVFQLGELQDSLYLLLDGVSESACVMVNGKACGHRICPPFRFNLTDACVIGDNTLQIEVDTTLGRANQDWLSQYLLMEKTGLSGRVRLQHCREQ